MKRWLVFSCLVGFAAFASAADADYEGSAPWRESELELPSLAVMPKLVSYEVSPANPNRFSVDTGSLAVGADGVLRYTLYVDTPNGVRNVTYEGMRCETRERRMYAVARSDGTWSRVKDEKWYRITEYGASRQYAALFLDYFCPGGVIVGSVAEARNALVRGGHPGNQRWW